MGFSIPCPMHRYRACLMNEGTYDPCENTMVDRVAPHPAPDLALRT